MNIKKFLLALIFVLALSLPACALDTFVIKAGPAALSFDQTPILSDDNTTVIGYEYSLKESATYEFSTFDSAFNFIKDPAAYVTNNMGYTLTDNGKTFTEIAVRFEKADTFLASYAFSELANLTTAAFTGSYTVTNAATARHFIIDKAGITLTFNGLTFAGGNGGGVQIDSAGTTTFTSVTFQNITAASNTANTTHQNGAVYVGAGGGSVNFDSDTFTGNSATKGGAVYIAGGTVNFNNGNSFTSNNNTTDGGAVYVENGTVNFAGSPAFSGNTATGSGGALYVKGGTVNFNNSSTFDQSNNAGRGGAVYIEGGTVNFTAASTFSSNYVTSGDGGAVYIASGTVNFANTSTFSGNTATGGNGGAVYIAGGSVSFTDTNIFNTTNRAVNGGAVYIAAGDVSFAGTGTFSSNTATTGGGAVYLASGTLAFTGNNAFETANSASNGGAMYIGGGTATFSDTVKFASNTASTNGGALYITGSGVAAMAGTLEFSTNTATYNGGAIYLSGSGRLTDNSATLTFAGNNAAQATYASVTTDPTSTGFLDDEGYGGAVCFAGNGTSTFGTVTFDNNIAPEGGAIALTGSGRVNFAGTASFGGSVNNAAWAGGAMYVGGGAASFAGTATFTGNTAFDDGGAVYVTSNGSLAFTASATFTKNSANNDSANYGSGGAIYWAGTGADLTTAFTVSDSSTYKIEFASNSALGNSTSTTTGITGTAARGGAIYFAGTGTFTINSGTPITFNSNTAYNHGGAIAADTGNVTFEGVTLSDANTATNGGGGLVYSAYGNVTVDNSNISGQTALDGGAVYAFTINITDSTISNNTSTEQGGAIYVPTDGEMTIESSTLSGNTAQTVGGDIFAARSTVTVTGSYFYKNKTVEEHGGALQLEGTTTNISTSTFEENTALNGGAIRAYGSITIRTSYFIGNSAKNYGGAVLFDQSGMSGADLIIQSSMFEGNVADGGQGGGVYVNANTSTIDSCTFYGNTAQAGGTSSAAGGGLYFDLSSSTTNGNKMIDNCTFFENRADGGQGSTGGGLHVAGDVTVRSSTFVKNTALTNGGGMIIAAGTVEILGTLVVGNNSQSDIYTEIDRYVSSGGYNRIGKYATVNGIAGWKLGPGATARGDEADPTWTMETFYNYPANVSPLADNIVNGSIPPLVGSTLRGRGQIRLQTIMLSEDKNLDLTLRAVNIIPWATQRFRFPQTDERGVDRWVSKYDLDIGPVYFGGVTSEEPATVKYEISRIILSGVPNSMRRIGQTASLVAKVYYTNRLTSYGGTGTGEEPVTWSVSPTGFLRISDNGVITAMRATTGTTYVTITVSTQRMNSAGEYVTDSARIKIDPDLTFGDLNNSPLSGNADANLILHALQQDFQEYNLGYGLIDKEIATVEDDLFQAFYEKVWGSSAAIVSSYTNSSFSLATAYSSSEGFTAAKGAGFSVILSGVNTGDLFPVVYPWEFSGEELKSALGSKIYASVSPDLAMSYTYSTPINYSVAEEIFSALRFEFEGKNISMPVLGSNTQVSIKDAIDSGALEITPSDGGKGLSVKLTAYLANVNATNTSSNGEIIYSGTYDGPALVEGNGKKLFVVPDGSDDGEIYGTMWLAQKHAAASSSSSSSSSTQTTNNQNSSSSSGSDSESSSGGGGGCNLMRNEELGIRSYLILLILALGLAVKRLGIRN